MRRNRAQSKRMNGTSKLSNAMLGNANAAKPDGESKHAFLAVRCLKVDRAGWIAAANRAKSSGKLGLDGRATSVLAAWVILTLNKAAKK